MKALFALVVTLGASGCVMDFERVQPWEREYLSKPEMAWDAGLVEERAMREHTYVSKEAASGGATIGGGGCGCN